MIVINFKITHQTYEYKSIKKEIFYYVKHPPLNDLYQLEHYVLPHIFMKYLYINPVFELILRRANLDKPNSKEDLWFYPEFEAPFLKLYQLFICGLFTYMNNKPLPLF
ncbi:hypothetical protein BOQ62_01425 [Chryseobacterium sp. CH21]|nr:hypothetical protein BOQ62_01425 [Chryseobacterium sp. CH21]